MTGWKYIHADFMIWENFSCSPRGAQGWLLALHSGITAGRTSRDLPEVPGTEPESVPGKYPTRCPISSAPKTDFQRCLCWLFFMTDRSKQGQIVEALASNGPLMPRVLWCFWTKPLILLTSHFGFKETLHFVTEKEAYMGWKDTNVDGVEGQEWRWRGNGFSGLFQTYKKSNYHTTLK